MKTMKKILKKLSSMFEYIVAGGLLLGLLVMKMVSSDTRGIDKLIVNKKKEVETKKKDLKELSQRIAEKQKAMDLKLGDSKALNKEITDNKTIRDEQAKKFFGG